MRISGSPAPDVSDPLSLFDPEPLEARPKAVASPNPLSLELESVPSYLPVDSRSTRANVYAAAIGLGVICATFVGSYELWQAVIKVRGAPGALAVPATVSTAERTPTPPSAGPAPVSSNLTAIASQPRNPTVPLKGRVPPNQRSQIGPRTSEAPTRTPLARVPTQEPAPPRAVATTGPARNEPSAVIDDSRNGAEPPTSASLTIDPTVSQPLAVSRPDASTPSSSNAEAVLALRVQDEQRVRGVLQRYALAYEQLDANAAKAVWPDVDVRALSRAFDGLKSQSITFSNCDLSVTGEAARAVCQGIATYVPKIGSKDPRTVRRDWAFELNKAEGGWTILNAETK